MGLQLRLRMSATCGNAPPSASQGAQCTCGQAPHAATSNAAAGMRTNAITQPCRRNFGRPQKGLGSDGDLAFNRSRNQDANHKTANAATHPAAVASS
eukprot:5626371-Amphidinium_carterae.1